MHPFISKPVFWAGYRAPVYSEEVLDDSKVGIYGSVRLCALVGARSFGRLYLLASSYRIILSEGEHKNNNNDKCDHTPHKQSGFLPIFATSHTFSRSSASYLIPVSWSSS